MTTPSPLRRPFRFLALFSLALALSLPAWEVVSGFYLAAVVHGVNAGLQLLAVPLRMPAIDGAPAIYPGIAGAVALFLVTPRQSWAWKARWLAALLALLFVLHAGLLVAEVLQLARHGGGEPSLAVRLGQRWGTSVLVIWVWLTSVRRRDQPALSSSP